MPSTGLLVSVPNKGAVVAQPPEMEEIEQIFEIRFLLEGKASRLATPRIAPVFLDKLEELHRRMSLGTFAGHEYSFLNREFHIIIYQASGWKFLCQVIIQRRCSVNHTGPLQGIRVLDFTHVLGGPYATMLLGDLGAEVIKVEPPGRGDSTRQSGPPFQNGESAYFFCVNRNKKSICVDLKKEEGRDLIRRMVKDVDVVVESFRPRVMEKLGLGYDEMKMIRPDLIYASLSAFGVKGPYREKPGFELILQGMTGLVTVTTEPGRKPSKIQIQVVDLCAGMFLAMAILAALYQRRETGKGQKVDTSLTEATAAMLANLAGIYFMTGKVPVGIRTRNPQVMPSQVFKTKDSYIAFVTQPQHWERFCRAIDKPEWIARPNLNSNAYRVAHYDEVEALIEEVTSTRTTKEWLERFERHEIAAGPINSVEEFFEDPLAKDLGLVLTVDHPKAGKIQLLKQPWNLELSAGGVRLPPPLLGQHTLEVLRDFGVSGDEIDSFKDKGVVFGYEG